jgi:hypothetical protein
MPCSVVPCASRRSVRAVGDGIDAEIAARAIAGERHLERAIAPEQEQRARQRDHIGQRAPVARHADGHHQHERELLGHLAEHAVPD